MVNFFVMRIKMNKLTIEQVPEMLRAEVQELLNEATG